MRDCNKCYYKNSRKTLEPCVSCGQYKYDKWLPCTKNPFDNESDFIIHVQEKKLYKHLSIKEKIKATFGR